MSPAMLATIAVEGDLDEAVLRKTLSCLSIEVDRVFGKKGKDYLRENLHRYNMAAEHGPWVVLVDLDDDAECPPPFVASWLAQRNPNLQLRVAVRAIEAWLLADREEIAVLLNVSASRIPLQPENQPDPKQTLISVARRSRSKRIREEIIPTPESSARQGPGYTSRLIEFAFSRWSPERAASNAPSLRRSLQALERWRADRTRPSTSRPRNPAS